MNAEDLEEELCNLLVPKKYAHTKLILSQKKSGFEVFYAQMYETTDLDFSTLLALSELFGTRQIDVDGYSASGCESCDYGSCYGHTIDVINPTKNTEHLHELFGRNLLKD